MPLGAHLVTPRHGYTHHGIYVGDGKVVHYAGSSRPLRRGPVQEVSLAAFAAGHGFAIRIDAALGYAAQVVVQRARSRLGESRYRLTTNNCEHFCAWCLGGESRSEQVERLLVWPRAIGAALERFTQLLRPASNLRRSPVTRVPGATA